MTKMNRIFIVMFFFFASSGFATDLSSIMSQLDREHNRDTASNMTHSHNADGSKRSKAEGQAISRSNRSGSKSHNTRDVNSVFTNSLHQVHNPYNIHQRPKLHERGSYAETCFTGDTLVSVSKEKNTELLPIKDVEVGDSVISCLLEGSDGRPKCTTRKVLAKSENFVDELLSISLDHGEIRTTFEHKFYVVDEGWVPAEELQIGYQLLSESGEIVFIKSIDTVDNIEDPIVVYDLKVEANEDDDHNYYVGTDRVLVHNCDIAIAGVANPSQGAGLAVRGWMTQATAKVGKELRKKPGKLGQFKGKDALRRENKVVRDVVKELKLSKYQQSRLHQDISGEGLGYHEIMNRAKEFFN